MLLTFEKLWKRIVQLEKYRYIDYRELPSYRFWVDKEAEIGAMPPAEAEWGTISVGDRWRGYDLTAWLSASAVIPAEWSGRKVVGLFDFGKTGAGHNSGFESLLYVNGAPYQGVGSNHKEVFFPETLVGEQVELLFKIWTGLNGEEGTKTELEHQLSMSGLAVLETEADDLYYTAFAVWHTIKVLGDNSWEKQALLKALDRSIMLINWRVPGDEAFYASVREANAKLKEELEAIPKFQPLTVRCIGHTHIDVAWLWRLRHTREKAARSFSTVLRLMEQFPDYVFLQTMPQLYEYIERDYPDIFAGIQERVKEGRWEAGGAMWLESDCNIPSGESLVRQLLYGMRYFENKFGVSCDYLWLPDVFGYSWALPQILQKSGLRYFMTTKISWNVYNRFPHDTFVWRGIDGTEVLTHYITTPDPDLADSPFTRFYTYNGQVVPATLAGIWNNYRDKEINDSELLLSYGWGDGGGGPTRTMLELRRRLEDMPGLPKATTGRADEFFRSLEQTVSSTDRYVHRWDGELYLELHRGTYTSQGYVKLMNRRMEFLLRDAEIVSSFAAPLAGFASYPAFALYESWKIVLRNQFHDILPGSSITAVYDDCRIEYAEAKQLADEALAGGLGKLASFAAADGRPGWMLYNTLTWARSELVHLPWEDRFAGKRWVDGAGRPVSAERISGSADGDYLQLYVTDIPPMGYTTVYMEQESEPASPAGAVIVCGERSASTPFYEIEWNEAGQLTRLFDKRSGREVIAEGETANRFDVHEDKPVNHDNWEIDIFYYDKVRQVTDIRSIEVIENGPQRAVIQFAWKYGSTSIRQDMILYVHNPRIDFSTWVDWQERETLLKVAFPVQVRATAATYEIQFGHVQRPTHWNTSWDFARFETCAHKWVDLSERGFGVSLMNDCKYGHDIRDNVMRITLLKSSNKPDPECDKGEHVFTYALLPHDGDWFAAGTVQQAYRLNVPVVIGALPEGGAADSSASAGTLPALLSLIGVESDHIMIDTVKKAEDSDEWIVRCYEYAGKRDEAGFRFHYRLGKVEEVNLAEREAAAMAFEEHGFRAYFKPFELKTFRIALAGT
ncbi:alpha-mannosidase [Paenibacillus ginsengarvi]|uniref:alpha-mannosidase n=1 Tax=Paenibacillus ginsengarvi TaxID=400777 RepID=A0A3B0BBC9_9BACL|nr:alpha-mannosidase [Paenibacillus ginsengarvi]RKN70132.1 alpha-mannosidase [Paenibacillus ginsengarvi]